MLSLPMAHSLTWQEFPFSGCPWTPRLCHPTCMLSFSPSSPVFPHPPTLTWSSQASEPRSFQELRGLLAAHSLHRTSPTTALTCLPTLANFSASLFVPAFKQWPGSLCSANHPRFFGEKVAGFFPSHSLAPWPQQVLFKPVTRTKYYSATASVAMALTFYYRHMLEKLPINQTFRMRSVFKSQLRSYSLKGILPPVKLRRPLLSFLYLFSVGMFNNSRFASTGFS